MPPSTMYPSNMAPSTIQYTANNNYTSSVPVGVFPLQSPIAAEDHLLGLHEIMYGHPLCTMPPFLSTITPRGQPPIRTTWIPTAYPRQTPGGPRVWRLISASIGGLRFVANAIEVNGRLYQRLGSETARYRDNEGFYQMFGEHCRWMQQIPITQQQRIQQQQQQQVVPGSSTAHQQVGFLPQQLQSQTPLVQQQSFGVGPAVQYGAAPSVVSSQQLNGYGYAGPSFSLPPSSTPSPYLPAAYQQATHPPRQGLVGGGPGYTNGQAAYPIAFGQQMPVGDASASGPQILHQYQQQELHRQRQLATGPDGQLFRQHYDRVAPELVYIGSQPSLLGTSQSMPIEIQDDAAVAAPAAREDVAITSLSPPPAPPAATTPTPPSAPALPRRRAPKAPVRHLHLPNVHTQLGTWESRVEILSREMEKEELGLCDMVHIHIEGVYQAKRVWELKEEVAKFYGTNGAYIPFFPLGDPAFRKREEPRGRKGKGETKKAQVEEKKRLERERREQEEEEEKEREKANMEAVAESVRRTSEPAKPAPLQPLTKQQLDVLNNIFKKPAMPKPGPAKSSASASTVSDGAKSGSESDADTITPPTPLHESEDKLVQDPLDKELFGDDDDDYEAELYAALAKQHQEAQARKKRGREEGEEEAGDRSPKRQA